MKNHHYDKARVRNLMKAEDAARTAFAHGYEAFDAPRVKPREQHSLAMLLSGLWKKRTLRPSLTAA